MNMTFDERFNSFAMDKGDNMKDVEALLGISRQALFDKRTKKFPFKLSEIQLLMVHWDMTPQQVYDLFLVEGLEEVREKYNEKYKRTAVI